MGEPSKACCTNPPIVAEGYVHKGEFINLGGLKTYHTTVDKPCASILFIYDVFGYFPQTLQGADILAHAGNFSVYMPDWFVNEYADITWYPPDTDEKKVAMKGVFERGNPAVIGPRVTKWMQDIRGEGKWGVVGLCWGGKIAAVVAGAGGFDCAAMAHPAMLNPEDAAKISVPFAVLASQDEDTKAVQEFSEALKDKKVVETFGDQIHGWMGARGDLKDARCSEQYQRGYKMLVDFFVENLGVKVR
ncbi:MAG: hypothetical protein M1840_003085 [Geoglossum simile]|nr:MAG: hypothetical protein M1840_003085 [Geoglossum simile]